MKISRTKLYTFITATVFCIYSCLSFGASSTRYTNIVSKYDNIKSEKILQQADKLESCGKKDEALILYIIVCNRFSTNSSESEKETCVLAHLKASTIYFDRGNYVNALEMEVNGIKSSEQCKRQIYASRLYNNIGNAYCVFLDYERGIRYYKKAYSFCKEYPDKDIENKILANITGMYTFLGNISEAKKYYMAYEKTRNKKDNTCTFMSGYMKGLIDFNEGKFHEAEKNYRKLAIFAKHKKLKPKYECFAYQELYNTFSATGQRDSMIKYMKQCYTTSHKYRIMHHFPNVLLDISEIYEKEGDINNANKYKSLYLSLKDSLFNTRQFDIVKNAQFQYEIGKTTKELQEMHDKNEARLQTIRKQWVALLLAVIIISFIIVLIVILHRQKKELYDSYHNLYRQNRENINMQKKYEILYKQNKKELYEKQIEIDMLTRKLDEKTKKQKDNSTQQKYKTSNLNEEKQKMIAMKIEEIMENSLEYCNVDFSLDTLAELVNSNSKYVSQVINDTFNKNFNNYINSYRIKLACERLIDVENFGNLTIKGISESVGFKSHTTFINVFRKHVGLTPSMYQAMVIKDSKTYTK